jgi:hypothetical protein
VVALLTARRSRIKVKDFPMAALVIINTIEISRMWRRPRATMRATSRGWSASSTIWFWRISWGGAPSAD